MDNYDFICEKSNSISRSSHLYEENDSNMSTHYVYDIFLGQRLLIPKSIQNIDNTLRVFIANPYVKFISNILLFVLKKRKVSINYTIFKHAELTWLPMDRLVIYIGTPGPYSKFTLLLLNERSNPISVIKLSLTNLASRLIEKEAKALCCLSSISSLRSHHPELLNIFSKESIAWMQTTVKFSNYFYDRNNIDVAVTFLRKLAFATQSSGAYVESNAYACISSRLKKIEEKLSPIWRVRMDSAMSTLINTAPSRQRYVWAHRDFTKWNVRRIDTGAFVFDWEYFEIGYPDAYDLLHYFFISNALKGCLCAKKIDKIKNIILKLRKSEIEYQNLEWQMLFYITDICIFYLESNSGVDKGDVLVTNYGKLIDDIVNMEKKIESYNSYACF